MALSIKHPEVDRLARALAARTGETLTEAILTALRERWQREQGRGRVARVSQELLRIADGLKRLPRLDARSADEILGYDEHGLPH